MFHKARYVRRLSVFDKGGLAELEVQGGLFAQGALYAQRVKV